MSRTELEKLGTHKGRRSDRDTEHCEPLFFNWPAAGTNPTGGTLLAGADPVAQALLHSQSGPFASRFLTTVPILSVLSYPCHLFRVLLLRRLRLPLPLAERSGAPSWPRAGGMRPDKFQICILPLLRRTRQWAQSSSARCW